mmetsp:Transcript_28554/g.51600  ORF Transcript_28554/g.51600 Transcript_28554/m.51600 type:complete len:200 (-) Transcript_28554:527-1126(-)
MTSRHSTPWHSPAPSRSSLIGTQWRPAAASADPATTATAESAMEGRGDSPASPNRSLTVSGLARPSSRSNRCRLNRRRCRSRRRLPKKRRNHHSSIRRLCRSSSLAVSPPWNTRIISTLHSTRLLRMPALVHLPTIKITMRTITKPRILSRPMPGKTFPKRPLLTYPNMGPVEMIRIMLPRPISNNNIQPPSKIRQAWL